jgi:DNA recombination protein RmuC
MANMELILIILVAVLLLVNAFVVYKLLQPKGGKGEGQEALLLLQQQMHDLSRTMDRKLSEANKTMQEGSRVQFRESRELIQEINREMNEQLRNVVKGVSEVGESSKQVFAVADQLRELQNILKNPKQRGILG